MTGRFLAILGRAPSEEVAAERDRIALGLAETGFAMSHRSEQLCFMSSGPTLALDTGAGLFIGTVFERDGGTPLVWIGRSEATHIVETGGAWPIYRHWGPYVAFIDDEARRRVRIVRPPLGEVSCYYMRHGPFVIAVSDAALLSAACLAGGGIAWEEVGRHLLASELRRERTCLAGVHELIGGNRLTVEVASPSARPLDQVQIWSPWSFASPLAALASRDEAEAAVRQTAMHCVAARARAFNRVLLGLSGGLDSSVVAACLADARIPTQCLTLVTTDPSGDESSYANKVASHLGFGLETRRREPERVDVMQATAPHLPRPVGRSFSQESERIALEVAGQTGCDALFRGGGGDNVFCFLQSVAPIADRLLAEGLGRGVFATARDMAELGQDSLGSALWRGAKNAWFRRSAYRWPIDRRFLAHGLTAAAAGSASHPWLEASEDILPGKAAHVALLLAFENHMHGPPPGSGLAAVSPLLSQPLIELCLRIPSWFWSAGGHNRAIARRAFESRLPRAIAWRRTKGTPDSFVIQIFEDNRQALREMLLGGLLKSQGFLDCGAIEQAFGAEGPVRGEDYARLMQLADFEAWARHWHQPLFRAR